MRRQREVQVGAAEADAEAAPPADYTQGERAGRLSS